jgi:hypothetical protein
MDLTSPANSRVRIVNRLEELTTRIILAARSICVLLFTLDFLPSSGAQDSHVWSRAGHQGLLLTHGRGDWMDSQVVTVTG